MRILVLLSCVVLAFAAQKSYDGYKVYTIQMVNEDQVDAVQKWEKHGIDIWDSLNSNNHPVRVMVPPMLANSFEDFLGKKDIFSDVIMENAGEVLAKEQKINEEIRSRSIGRSSISFDHYFRYDEITSFLQELAEEFPNLITVESAGTSYDGRNMWLAKISNSGFDGSKPVIFIDAGIHAREWIAPMSILYLMHEIVEHSEDYADMFEVDWMIIPMANPDGYEYSHTDDRMWRKTRSSNSGSTCLGTDPNRNFEYQWEVGTSTSDNPCSLIFRGPNPESEVEVRIISDLLRQYSSQIKLYLAIHSFGDYLIYPYGYDFDIPNPNTDNLYYLGVRVSNAIQAAAPSRIYTVGNSATLLYPASGASDDFASGGAGIGFAYTVELTGGGSTGFDLPPEYIQQISGEIFVGYREYARFIADQF